MKEKDGKKAGEGFATASKVVRPPEPFEPKNMEEISQCCPGFNSRAINRLEEFEKDRDGDPG